MRTPVSHHKVGLPPGMLVYEARGDEPPVQLSLLTYDADQAALSEPAGIDEVLAARDQPSVSWINLSGIHDLELLRKLGRHFDIHDLVLEDVVNIGQRAKVEPQDGCLFLNFYMIRCPDDDAGEVVTEQVSAVLHGNCLLTFQQRPGDVWDPLRQRILNNAGVIRQMGADYLLYALLDLIVDNYLLVLEIRGEDMDELDADLLRDPGPKVLGRIHRQRREILYLRKLMRPMREMVGTLERADFPEIDPRTHPYVRDLYDHMVRVLEATEHAQDMLSAMKESFNTAVNNRLNQVMKLLTIISTIFIPMSFVAGLYGMNFSHEASALNMPELYWRYGYFYALGLMLLLALGMLWYFRRQRWL